MSEPTHAFDVAPLITALVVADDILKRQQLGKVLCTLFSMCDVTINPKYSVDIEEPPHSVTLGGVTYTRRDVEASEALRGS